MTFGLWALIVGVLLTTMALAGSLLRRLPLSTGMLYLAVGIGLGPVVLLSADGKTIPVFVDHTVAASIQAALTGEKLPRPLSHDLMHTILESLGGRVVRTVITLKAGTYYGSLTVAFQGQEKVFDSRSSDSIALAIHFQAPILVGRDMLDAVGTSIGEPKPEAL